MKLSDFLIELGRPIAFYPGLRKLTGSINATLFLCQFVYWTGKERSGDGWIYKTAEQIQEETGLTYREQGCVRKKLVASGLLTERYERINHRMNFKVNIDLLNDRWAPDQTSVREPTKRQFGNRPNVSSLIGTTEITTEITNIEDEDERKSKINSDPQFKFICKAWTKLHGIFTHPDALFLGELLNDWRKHQAALAQGHPDLETNAAEVVTEAIRITAENAQHQRSHAYARKIVQTWITNGYGWKPLNNKMPIGSKYPKGESFLEKLARA